MMSKMRKWWKKGMAAVLSAGMILSLAACSTSTPTVEKKEDTQKAQEAEKKSVEDIKIAAILIASSQVTASLGNGIKDYAESLGAECTLQYYEQNIATQADMIEHAVTSGVDIIIMQNQSAADCVTEINKAVEAGVTVIMYGDAAEEINYDYNVTEDSLTAGYQIGSMAAEWANENLVANGIPVIVAVGNYSVTELAVKRKDGILKALEEKCPEAEIADIYEMAYKTEGLEVGENILQAHPDVNLVVGINDQSVCGVYEAFQAAGKNSEKIGMFGIDGTAEAMYLISEDTMMKGVTELDNVKIAKQMVDMGIAKVTGDSSAPAEKQLYWTLDEVTKENINDYKDKWGELAK